MGGGCRNVSRMPTARSIATPAVGTSFSSSRSTKLLRAACGHTSPLSRDRNVEVEANVISHCRIHSRTESPQAQCVSRPKYWSVKCRARSSLRCSITSGEDSATMSSVSTMAPARSMTSARLVSSGIPCTSKGGNSCVADPGTSMYDQSISPPQLQLSAHEHYHCFVYNTNSGTICTNLVMQQIRSFYRRKCYDPVPISEATKA